MGRAKGVGMPKRHKTKVEGEGQRRNAVEVGRVSAQWRCKTLMAQLLVVRRLPRSHSIRCSLWLLGQSRRLRSLRPPAQRPSAGNTGSGWALRVRSPGPSLRSSLRSSCSVCAKVARRYDNNACTCGGVSESGDANGHSMFCQIYKCYAHEVGCCDKISSSEEEWEYRCETALSPHLYLMCASAPL